MLKTMEFLDFGELFRGTERAISRLACNTHEIDVVNYIRSETNVNFKCDPLPTKYDSYTCRSYNIHAHPRHHDLLLRPGMWPRNVILRQYKSDD